ILAKIRLDWAVMFFLFALPSYQIRFDCLGVPATLLEAMILISFSVWLFKNYKKIINNVKIKLKTPPARGWSASGGKIPDSLF
ncbi:MAG: hypothetical protein KAS78_05385, partial [Candidatus Pacebacteria bacterium]|nr:hypothetical protein [Candidatus Paceibacterota bacterium]